MNLLAGDVNDLGAGELQKHEVVKHPLFVEVDALDFGQHFLIQRQAGHYDHGAGRVAVREHGAVQIRKTGFQHSEAPPHLIFRQLEQVVDGFGGHTCTHGAFPWSFKYTAILPGSPKRCFEKS